MSAKTGRRLDHDLLRVLCMAGVVYLHTAAGALRAYTGVVWHFANLASSLATAAVPLFFMLSGALLLGQESTGELSTLFRRRLPKVAVPLVVWSLVVIALEGFQKGAEAAGSLLLNFLSNPVLVPYWFLYALIPIYLVTPFLKRMTDRLQEDHWNYLVLLWLVLTIGLRTIRDFLPADHPLYTALTVHWTFNINFVDGYLGYFLLGARLVRLKRLPSRRVLWAAALGSYGIIAVGTWLLRRYTGTYDERFKSYVHIFTVVLSIAIFLLARSYLEHDRSPRWLAGLSGLSFGVYLVHPMAISFWMWVWGNFFHWTADSLGRYLLLYVEILLSCLAGIFLVASIKPLCFPLTGQRFSAACRESNLFALLRRDGAGPDGDTPRNKP